MNKLEITTDEQKTSIEELSNEFFYEIFEYLNGIDIYHAFSDLNHRFEKLLYNSSFLLKIKLDEKRIDEIYLENFKRILLHNKHQIFSIDLSISKPNNQIISWFIINSSFLRLESLVLHLIELDVLISVLSNLRSLPRLFSLTVNTKHATKYLNDIYRLIFALPKLKYAKCSSFNDFVITATLFLATNNQSSTIEHLFIDHGCTLDGLFSIISYTPQLRCLEFDHLLGNVSSTTIPSPNFINISLCVHNGGFDEFEMFIRKSCSKLKVLSLTSRASDMNYINADRWKQLILTYLPQLEKFSLRFHVSNICGKLFGSYPTEPNQFTSSFWFERQWILNANLDHGDAVFSIRPYKEQWYEYEQDKMINSPNEFSKSMRLTFINDPSISVHFLNIDITRVLSVAQIYHLNIVGNISIDRLLGVLFLLLKLDSLQISSLSLRRLSDQEVTHLAWISKQNYIMKVNLETMNDTEELYFLINLCPRMIYLKVNSINNMDIESFVRGIIMKMKSKSNHHLRLLCFRVPSVNYQIVERLEKMINFEKLLCDYIIKRVFDYIHLQWK